MKKFLRLFVFSVLIAVAISSCKKDDPINEPMGCQVAGDWITPTSVDYQNFVLTPMYTYIYSAYTSDGQYVEKGNFTYVRDKTITFYPEIDGATSRTLTFSLNGDNITLKGKMSNIATTVTTASFSRN